LADRAAAKAAASFGRRSRASVPLPVSTSVELGDECEFLGLGEAGQGGLLGLDAEAGAALALGRDPIVGTNGDGLSG